MPFPWNQAFNSFSILTKFSSSFNINGSTTSFHPHEITFLKVSASALWFLTLVPELPGHLSHSWRPDSHLPPLVSRLRLGLWGLFTNAPPPPILASRPTDVAGGTWWRDNKCRLGASSGIICGSRDLQTLISTRRKGHVGHFLKIWAYKSRAQPDPSPSGTSKIRQP